jgi:hypothetical protein
MCVQTSVIRLLPLTALDVFKSSTLGTRLARKLTADLDIFTNCVESNRMANPSYSPHSRDSLAGMGPPRNWGSGGNGGWWE